METLLEEETEGIIIIDARSENQNKRPGIERERGRVFKKNEC